MILLIGGTSETAPLADGIAAAGFDILVSTATDAPLAIGDHPRISHRVGRLDEAGMVALAADMGIRAIVDAAHPYAATVHAAAQRAAQRHGIPCLVFQRPAVLIPDKDRRSGAVYTDGAACTLDKSRSAPPMENPDSAESGGIKTAGSPVCFAADHAEAAKIAFAFGSPVFLTTGSRNLAPYVTAARRTGIPLAVRVLDAPESLDACQAAGIREDRIIAGRGPFSVEENLAAIRRFGIGVIVTKDSGQSGGVEAKLAAARQTYCRVIVIRRPETPTCGPIFNHPTTLITALKDIVNKKKEA
jgi:precorrin-6A/cobalt-precorrin-6A reductase